MNFADLTGFQRDILWALAGHEPIYGLGLKAELESGDYDAVGHPKLYTNLGDLRDAGLVNVEEVDGRTNHYTLTDDAREMLQLRLAWEAKMTGVDL